MSDKNTTVWPFVINEKGVSPNEGLKDASAEIYLAAQEIVDRWDSPLWKDKEHTSVYINRLRRALAKARGE